MSEFITGIFTFPTVFFSGLLVLVLFYWLTAVLGVSSFETAEGDVALDTDLDVSDTSFSIANLLSKFRLDGIPITISLSFIILASWVLSFLAVYFIYPVIPQGWIQIAVGFWILLLVPVLSATIVSPLLQPLKPIFKKTPEKRAVDLVGQYVTVRSGKVTATVGEAVFHDGGAGLILKIRCPEENEIKRGDSVKLFSFDQVTHTYQITHK
ncbi:hypothetical protein [Leucothrix arctica]|uniref:DUF1449 domain-containing protein n=1 Tax=Leucothrix arctica TaxID=1481894 RepID=A0A317CKY3_9GAMM|nr:hypothetical protein [Leucothrix arctica]PWQ98093.1 hypothetical protein DKT75_04840 [Leucothrix arctica]